MSALASDDDEAYDEPNVDGGGLREDMPSGRGVEMDPSRVEVDDEGKWMEEGPAWPSAGLEGRDDDADERGRGK